MNDDLYAHFQFTGSDVVKLRDRTYYNLINVFSLAGGLMLFIHLNMFLMYYFFNYYKLLRHVV